MTPKVKMLPPAGKTQKREANVNIRFCANDIARLKRIAAYRGTTVTQLLHYVTTNTVLPLLEEEMQQELAEANPSTDPNGTGISGTSAEV